MITLYVEGSLCSRSGAAGWGCTTDLGDAELHFSGFLANEFGTSTTLMELCAAARAFSTVAERYGLLGQPVTIAMRSTAALAVLRWVFPDAPFSGAVVHPPKALKSAVKNAQCLYDLHDHAEALKAQINLALVTESRETRAALQLAREQMTWARRADRRMAG